MRHHLLVARVHVFAIFVRFLVNMSKKQPTIAMASQEAEIYASSLAGLEAVFLRILSIIKGPTTAKLVALLPQLGLADERHFAIFLIRKV